MDKYQKLKMQYPDYISLGVLGKVCKITRRSALYLVENGIIPAIDTGKKTWRYQIAIDDVIVYLQKREKVGSMIPRGAVSSRKNNHASPQHSKRNSFAALVTAGQEYEVAEYFKFLCADFDEILTTDDVSKITGLPPATIQKLVQNEQLKSLTSHPTYLIPKAYLLEFVVTKRFLKATSHSETFQKILGGFELWKNAKSSQ